MTKKYRLFLFIISKDLKKKDNSDYECAFLKFPEFNCCRGINGSSVCS